MEERQKARSSVKCLLVRFSAIGDCVMAIPAALAFKDALPGCEVTWCVEQRCADVVLDPDVAIRHQADRQAWKKGRWSPAMWRSQLRYYLSLRGRGFDYGVDLQGHSKTALCLRLAKPTKRVMLQATDALAAKMNPVMGPVAGHTVEKDLAAIKHLGLSVSTPKWVMPMYERPTEIPNGRVASIAVSAGHVSKTYPLEIWLKVARGLTDAGLNVVWLGGPGDPQPGVDTDLVGRLHLSQTMAVVQHSAIHLAADTGTGHMAAAYGIPSVSLFGPTDPELYRPYSERTQVLRVGATVAEISPDEVLAAALEQVTAVG